MVREAFVGLTENKPNYEDVFAVASRDQIGYYNKSNTVIAMTALRSMSSKLMDELTFTCKLFVPRETPLPLLSVGNT